MLSPSHEFLMHHAREHLARRRAEAALHGLLREGPRSRGYARRVAARHAASLRAALAGLLAGLARVLAGAAERVDPRVA